MSVSEWAEISETIMEFFIAGKTITHKRVTKEYEAYNRKKDNAKASAKKRWNKNNELDHANACETHMPNECERNANQNQNQNQNHNIVFKRNNEAFEVCWKSYPHVKTRMSKSKAKAAFDKLPSAEQNNYTARSNPSALHSGTVTESLFRQWKDGSGMTNSGHFYQPIAQTSTDQPA